MLDVNELLRDIPLAEAASFFIRVKSASAAHVLAQDGALIEECLKQAQGLGATGVAPELPSASKGMAMAPVPTPALPATAQGQNKVASEAKDPDAVGKERAKASLSAEFAKDKAHGGERWADIAGRAAGAVGGGLAAHRYGGRRQALATVAGAALGEHLGGKAGRYLGAESDGRVHDKLAAAMQQAAQNVGIQPQLPPEAQAYVQNEQVAQQAEEQGQSQYLQQQLAQMREQTQAAQQENEQLQQQQAATTQQLDMYQQQVSQATQQALGAQDQVLQQQQAAAASRMAYQQLRGQLLDMASKDPPNVNGADAAQQAYQAAQAGAPAPDAGPAGQAPFPGTPPGSPAPQGDQPVAQNAGQPGGPDMGTAQPAAQTSQSDTPMGQQKTSSLALMFKAFGNELLKRAPHAAVGAAVGAGAGLAESKMSNEPLRGRVAELEGTSDRSMGQAMDLAQAKARLSFGNWAEEHPKTMTGMGAVGGAVLGGTTGPRAVQAAKDLKPEVGKTVDVIRRIAKS